MVLVPSLRLLTPRLPTPRLPTLRLPILSLPIFAPLSHCFVAASPLLPHCLPTQPHAPPSSGPLFPLPASHRGHRRPRHLNHPDGPLPWAPIHPLPDSRFCPTPRCPDSPVPLSTRLGDRQLLPSSLWSSGRVLLWLRCDSVPA